MVDVAAIPDRFENRVVETEDHDVLHGFFAEVVINAVNLALVENALDLAVQGLGGIEIVSEGFFDDDTPKPTTFFARQAGRSQLPDDGSEELRRSGEIKNIV